MSTTARLKMLIDLITESIENMDHTELTDDVLYPFQRPLFDAIESVFELAADQGLYEELDQLFSEEINDTISLEELGNE